MSTITFIHPQYAVCRAKTEFCNDDKVDHSKSVVIDLEYVTNLHTVVITVYCTTKLIVLSEDYICDDEIIIRAVINERSEEVSNIFINRSVYSHHLQ